MTVLHVSVALYHEVLSHPQSLFFRSFIRQALIEELSRAKPFALNKALLLFQGPEHK